MKILTNKVLRRAIITVTGEPTGVSLPELDGRGTADVERGIQYKVNVIL